VLHAKRFFRLTQQMISLGQKKMITGKYLPITDEEKKYVLLFSTYDRYGKYPYCQYSIKTSWELVAC
jgi:hypothetical protein